MDGVAILMAMLAMMAMLELQIRVQVWFLNVETLNTLKR